MQIFVINLDRNPVRWQRMAGLLAGLDCQRIVAVDGKNLDGPEYNDPAKRGSYEGLSRFNRACILSHRAACETFLAGDGRHACILEDDIFFSPHFADFIRDESWIPTDADLVKIETTQQEVLVSTKTIACLDRTISVLLSLHFGTGAYIVSRRGAQKILELTESPLSTIDTTLFGRRGLKALRPVYQMYPAPCIQASHRADGMIFPEMESTIQPKIVANNFSAPVKNKFWNKIEREFTRPFRQLQKKIAAARLRLLRLRRCRVPFA